MQRIVLLLFLLQSWLFGCLSCSGGAIYVTTQLTLSIHDHRLENIRVHWYLDPVFSQLVLGDFDTNRNKRFDANEVSDVFDNLLSMQEYNFFTDFKLNDRLLTLTTLQNFDVRFDKGLVSYHFDIPTNLLLGEALRFDGGFKDLEARDGSIFYQFDKQPIIVDSKLPVTLDVTTREQTDRDGWITQRITATLSETPPQRHISQTEKPAPRPPGILSRSLKAMTDAVHAYLVEIQQAPSAGAVAMILLISLLYGMLHAAGPGHGKMLVASYFVAHNHSYTKALILALMIAAVHVFSALVLTLGIYYLLDSVFSKTLEDASRYITAGSGLVIILIALYLFWQKWRIYNRPLARFSFNEGSNPRPLAPPNTLQPHTHSCGCHSCKTTTHTTDLTVVILAGIVPCPGTVIIFMFALSMGLYLVGFASAVVMSLGMGATIALTALLSTRAKRSTQQLGSRMIKLVEYGSLAVMASLGLFLLFA
jgi:ABC-type nickel/cobalt efflux system permease component RcnA/ABC-type uncharacterized transport system substrate-binding protein